MHDMRLTFLGTTSGGGPTETRNCSSLVLDALGDGSLWMFDCAEGTVRQFAQQPYRYGDQRYVRMAKVNKIFITHMHADHTMGIITILRNVLGIKKSSTSPGRSKTPEPVTPKVEIYGPSGIRRFVRTIFTLTHTHSADKYAVHELLMSGETPSASARSSYPDDTLHESELPGRDIPCGPDGFWRNVLTESYPYGGGRFKVQVDAGPIVHRDPCIGFIIREVIGPPQHEFDQKPVPEARNVVILGDTSDPTSLMPLINSPPSVLSEQLTTEGVVLSNAPPPRVTLLVHEATDAFIPLDIDTQRRTGKNRTEESVEAKMLEKGHSTPVMAGKFAKLINAERLVLNHIGARFPAPDRSRPQSGWERFRRECMKEIERQAEEAWQPRYGKVIAAWDFCTVDIPAYKVRLPEPELEGRREEPVPWEREDETPLQYQVWGREESREIQWISGPGYRSRVETGTHGDEGSSYERRANDTRPDVHEGRPYEQRRGIHTQSASRRGADQRSESGGRLNANQKRDHSGGRGYGRRGSGGPSRGRGRGTYSDKRPRNS